MSVRAMDRTSAGGRHGSHRHRRISADHSFERGHSLFALALPILAVLLGVALPVAARAAVNLVVMEARGIGLTPGQTIDGSQPLVLKEGQQVSLISYTGQTIKLKGPSEKAPAGDQAAAKADVAAAMQALLAQRIDRNDRAGVVRGAGKEPIPPEPWLIDATHAGTRCVIAGAPVTFWRPVVGGRAPRVVTPSDRSWRINDVWPATADRWVLPQSIKVTQRSNFVVKLADREVTLAVIGVPATLENDAMRAAWMMEAGCDRQAIVLLKQASAQPAAASSAKTSASSIEP